MLQKFESLWEKRKLLRLTTICCLASKAGNTMKHNEFRIKTQMKVDWEEASKTHLVNSLRLWGWFHDRAPPKVKMIAVEDLCRNLEDHHLRVETHITKFKLKMKNHLNNLVVTILNANNHPTIFLVAMNINWKSSGAKVGANLQALRKWMWQ